MSMDFLSGSKTFLAAVGFLGIAAYNYQVLGDTPTAIGYFFAALGLYGSRVAIAKLEATLRAIGIKIIDPVVPTPEPAKS